MTKIAFLAPFIAQQDCQNLLSHLKYQTPNNKGIWKELIGVEDYKEADYYVMFEDLNKGMTIDFNRTICFQMEPPYILKIIKDRKNMHYQKLFLQDIEYLKNYTFENHHYPCTWNSRIPFDDLNVSSCPEKNKNLSCVMRNSKAHEGHRTRLKYLTKFAQEYPEDIDIYGWQMPINGSYKGPVRDGYTIRNASYMSTDSAFKDYKYSLVCEGSLENVMATRLYDCILNWTFPIYWGNPRVHEYFSKEVVIPIDVEKENTSKLYELSKKAITAREIELLHEARQLILHKYNIWEDVYQTLSERGAL